MRVLNHIESHLKKFESKYGINVSEAGQGSEEWKLIKLGVLSASNAHRVVASRSSEARRSYMAELVAQVCTGIFPEVSARPLEWGLENEGSARSAYQLMTGHEARPVLFGFQDEPFRVGVSSDFVAVVGDGRPGEIKCPYTTSEYIQFLTMEKIKSEWHWQMQMGMWVLQTDVYDFCQFDPRMRSRSFHSVSQEPDEKAQRTLADAVPQFVYEMDKVLEKTGIKFGDQWTRFQKNKEAS